MLILKSTTGIRIIALAILSMVFLINITYSQEIIGKKAPDFELNDLNGNKVKLSDFKGKVVMLNFWASWCGPCRMEIPDLINIQEKHKKDGLIIIGITIPSSGTPEQVKKFAESYKINYILVTGSNTEIMTIATSYGGVRAVPTTFLIDRDGIVRHQWIGARSKDDFMKEVKKYLK